MTISLYRVINPGDQFAAVQQLVANNLISYNNSTNVNIHNPFITSYRIANTTGIGNNQAAVPLIEIYPVRIYSCSTGPKSW